LVKLNMNSNFSRRTLFKGLLSASAVALIPMSGIAEAAPSSLALQAVQQALRGDFLTGGDLAQQSGDQAAVKLVELLFLRDHGAQAGHARIVAFLDAAPNWPLTDTLLKRAEQALYENTQDTNTALVHFSSKKPLTPYGMLALARARYVAGKTEQAKSALREAWNSPNLTSDLEKLALAEFGNQLTIADHKSRLWRLIYAQEGNAAVRHAKRLGGDYQKAAAVGQMLLRGDSGADRRYAALPAGMKNELALRLVLARYYRRQGKFDQARSILMSANDHPNIALDPQAWWEERRIVARRSVGPNHGAHWNAAYQMSRDHGLPAGESAIEAEFIAGWVALRYLKKPDTAMVHFAKLDDFAVSRTDKARAAYWIGRTHTSLGDKASARAAYQAAAKHSTVYYGQLAREQLGLGNTPESINGGQASAAAQAKVERDEVVRAMRLMSQAGTKDQLNMFLWSLASRFKSTDEMNAAAAIVQNIAGTSWSLRLAKAASQRHIDIDAWSYPITGLPRWAQIGKPIERSLVFALSRQESEFDPNAGSSVGAQGLMQLMPGTARLVANQYRVPYTQSKLRSDPAYNVKLGAAHLADLVDNFNGSYVLTLVAYNAGPRRSREWVEEYGDPRAGQVDAVDWIECIPFEETRGYVQKVMQNVHVYRSRLAPDSVRPMTADLKRGTPAELSVASTTPSTNPTACKGHTLSSLMSSCD
jgi:soluble lytic murein transglycosylase